MVLKSVLKIEQTVSTAFFYYLPIMPFHPRRWVRLIKHDWSFVKSVLAIANYHHHLPVLRNDIQRYLLHEFLRDWSEMDWPVILWIMIRDPWNLCQSFIVQFLLWILYQNLVYESINQPTWSFWPLRLSLENQYMSCREVSGRFSMLYCHNTQNYLELSLHEVTTMFISRPLLIISVL